MTYKPSELDQTDWSSFWFAIRVHK